jgi:hypothetical protein
LNASSLPTDKYQEELLLSRTILKTEMGKAMRAVSPKEKKALLASWREAYSPALANELLRVAKDSEARYRIANWNLTSFDENRRKSK